MSLLAFHKLAAISGVKRRTHVTEGSPLPPRQGITAGLRHVLPFAFLPFLRRPRFHSLPRSQSLSLLCPFPMSLIFRINVAASLPLMVKLMQGDH